MQTRVLGYIRKGCGGACRTDKSRRIAGIKSAVFSRARAAGFTGSNEALNFPKTDVYHTMYIASVRARARSSIFGVDRCELINSRRGAPGLPEYYVSYRLMSNAALFVWDIYFFFAIF